MSNENDALFQRWLHLRADLKRNKQNKQWKSVIDNCSEIVQLDSKAKFIGIMLPIFYREAANAYEKRDDTANAHRFYSLAKDAFLSYIAASPLRNPDDWLSDIQRIEKKLSKLQEKGNRSNEVR